MHDKSPPRFELEAFHRDVSDDDLIADLVRVSDELGKKRITFREYNKTGKFSSQTIATRFGSWLGAQERAGLEKSDEKNISNEIIATSGERSFFITVSKNIDKEFQRNELLKDLEYQKGFLLSIEKKLSNERFVQNAKPEVVEVEKKKKADAEAKIKAIEETLQSLSS